MWWRAAGACRVCGRGHAWEHEVTTPPTCCGQPVSWTQLRCVRPEREGWSTGMKAPAIDFNQTRGRIAPIGPTGVPINSLHDIRRLERESERREANGEGSAVQFLKYSMERGNETQGLHHHQTLRTHDAQGRQILSAEAITPEAADSDVLGPGITGDGDSGFPS